MASFLLTEARQHNTEIRMAVSKVADKMDHLMSKVTESVGAILKVRYKQGIQMENN